MAAVYAIPCCVAHLDSGLLESKNPRPRTGLDDDGQKAGYMSSNSRERCDSVCMERGETCKPATPPSTWQSQRPDRAITALLSLLDLERDTNLLELDPPPSYFETITDAPPTYQAIESLDQLHVGHQDISRWEIFDFRLNELELLLKPMTPSTIDFGDSSTFRQVGKKKKPAARAKWADSGDEAPKDEGGGEGNGGGGGGDDGGGGGGCGGGGGGSNDDDGGAGDDGGGGHWNTGNKKKKGKKGKAADEEEEKKKKEQEEEQRKKDEAEAASDGDPLSWANGRDGNADDDWGGFTTTAKKGKKGKKDKVEAIPEPPAALNGFTSNFDDISLDDTPKLDLNFGAETGTKDATSGFGFGGWGSSWNTPNKWDLGGADLGSTDTTDATKSTNDTSLGGFDSSWSFGSTKKNKKKTTASGFDFGNFVNLEETNEEEESVETKGGTDNWATGFTPGKQDKKKKKSALDNLLDEPDPDQIGAALVEPVAAAEDTWGGWGGITSKKDKKKGKKGEADEVPPVPPPPPAAPVDAMDEWGSLSTKKDKKKGKKGATDEAENPDHIVVMPEAEPEAGAAWGSFSTKKDKKKGKKDITDESGKTEDPISVVPDAEPETDLGRGNFSTKKDKSKSKKGVVEEDKAREQDIVEVPDLEPEAEIGGWGSFGTKKDKKKGKMVTEEEEVEESAAGIVEEPEPETGVGWDSPGTKKDKKKGKKGIEEVKDPESTPMATADPEPEADASWGFGSKKDKKKGKKIAEEDKKEEPSTEVVGDTEVFDDWGSFGKKDKKKNKKGASEEPYKTANPITNIDHEPEEAPAVDSGLGAFASKKDKKKGKKGVTEDPWPAEDKEVIKVHESEPLAENMLGSFASTSKKDKKGKKGGLWDVKEDPVSAFDFTTGEATNTVTDTDNWMGFGSDKKKDKKGKKGITTDTKSEEPLPPPPPPVPTVPDVSTFDSWGSSKKDKDKKKKGKVIEPEPAVIAVPDPVEENKPDSIEDGWGTWGFSPKDKKKKEKEREREREEQKKREQEDKEREEEEREKEKEKEKGKTKGGKKGKVTSIIETPKSKDLTNNSMFDATPAAEDTWGSWGASKKDKKKGGTKDIISDFPPPAPTPPAQGLTPEPTIDDIGDDDWGDLAPAKSKSKKDAKKSGKEDSKSAKKGIKDVEEDAVIDSPKDDKNKHSLKADTPAKAAKSFWGSIGATSTSKSKTSKDKDVDMDMDKDINKLIDELDSGMDSDEIVGVIEEPVKKGSKSKSDSKLSKLTGRDGDKASKDSDKASKLSDKKKKDATTAVVEEATVSPKESKSSKGLGAKDKSDDKKDDAWGFWGSSKKTSGKKADEPKKEITKPDSPNQKSSLKAISNEPEGTSKADEPSQSTPSKSSKSTMSTSKPSGKLSVAQKVKALEEERKKALLEPVAPPPVAEWESLSKADSPPQKSSSTAKAKLTATSKDKSSKKKDLSSSSPVEDKRISKDSVPGSFPGEGLEDDLIDMMIDTRTDKKSKKKDPKARKDTQVDLMDLDSPIGDAPPTPPAEPTSPKPAKKERARVVRDEGASSWGFWGVAPKKDVKKDRKSKDDADVTSPAAKERTPAPGLSRSKSTRTAKEKETEKSKSSGSDKAEKEKKAESRPSKSRQSSFGGFFGGPSPARAKPARRTSTAGPKSASRRQSMDVDATGLPSPPPDAPDMTPKAAKLMGMGSGKLGRKESTRGKQKASAVPDPYAIDDDDMVMVNGLEDPVVNAPIPKKSSKKEKASRSTSKAEADLVDDIVIVESGQDGPEPLAFDEKPRGLQRSMTSAKKPDNKIMGLFGGFGRKSRRASDTYERPRKIVAEDEGNLRRKRTVTGGGDAAKRLRRDDRKIRRSDKDGVDADGFITDAAGDGGAATDAEDAEARKEERRAKRAAKEQAAKDAEDAKLRDEKEKRAKRRELERAEDEKRKARARDARDRRARKEDEAEALRQGEKRARRAAREELRAKEDTRDLEIPPTTERRSKHREHAEAETSRPRKSDRRRSHMDKPMSPTPADEPDRHERRSKPKSSRRKSTAPVEDYFDPRNGKREMNEEPGSGYPHSNANDHTSSWVKSQLSDPAPPPPIEPTVIEPPPVLGGTDKYEDTFVAEEDERRAMHRKSRRHSKYAANGDDAGGDGGRRRRREEVRSEESEDGRVYPRKGKSDFVLGAGTKVSGAGVPGGKRGSWFKRVGLPL